MQLLLPQLPHVHDTGAVEEAPPPAKANRMDRHSL